MTLILLLSKSHVLNHHWRHFILIAAYEIAICVLSGCGHVSFNQRLHPCHADSILSHEIAPTIGLLRQQPHQQHPRFGARHANHQDRDGPARWEPVPKHTGTNSHRLNLICSSSGKREKALSWKWSVTYLHLQPLICNDPRMIVIRISSSGHNRARISSAQIKPSQHHCYSPLSPQVTSNDKTPTVISSALEKHNQDPKQASRYELIQLLPEGKGKDVRQKAHNTYWKWALCFWVSFIIVWCFHVVQTETNHSEIFIYTFASIKLSLSAGSQGSTGFVWPS